MNKSQLIDRIAEKKRLHRKKAEQAVNLIFGSMVEALEHGGRVEIRGFGSFSRKEYRAYGGRNPKTGEPIPVASKLLPRFKVGKELKKRVDGK